MVIRPLSNGNSERVHVVHGDDSRLTPQTEPVHLNCDASCNTHTHSENVVMSFRADNEDVVTSLIAHSEEVVTSLVAHSEEVVTSCH